MISLTFELITLEKRVPLTISRGTSTHSEILWVRLAGEGHEGWGEAAAFSIDGISQPLADLRAGLEKAKQLLRDRHPLDRLGIEQALRAACVPSAAIAGVDQALWDWLGHATGLPVARLWGLDPSAGPVTSVTVGISAPEAAQKRVRQWLEVGDVRAFKIKLGSPAGLAADRAMFAAVAEVLPAGVKISVDANGGWSADDAIAMSAWLAERGVDHLEQPLSRGREADLFRVRKNSPLPVILDESVLTSADIPPLAALDALDGINIKLMKSGGLSEALRLVHTARAHGLRILVGCYGNTALGNTAGANLGPLVDYLDLDSHLNLKADPFGGAVLKAGRLQLPPGEGFGISHKP